MLQRVMILVIVSLFILVSPVCGVSSKGPLIRVGIISNQENIFITAEKEFSLVDAETGNVISRCPAGVKVTLSNNNVNALVNGKPTTANEIKVVFPTGMEQTLEINKRFYRGAISVRYMSGKHSFTVVNTLALEDYLCGVLPREISPEWPVDALKAQAIAARTYAIYSMNKHKSDGYDVCATTDCQVYGGIAVEDDRTNMAVYDTKGLVMVYNDKPIPALFHCSSGGYTENSENVWGGYFPFLRSVKDYDEQSPYYKWEKRMLVADLEAALKRAGHDIGKLQAVKLSQLDEQVKSSIDRSDRTISGRVKSIRFIGSQDEIALSGTEVRSLVGLNSTLFDVKVVSPAVMNVKGEASAIFVFEGYGWGHGIGLSQWGAKAMAEQAPQGAAEYFKVILKHYYSGVSFEKEY
ncbi:MAG: SpoIID/LytB domain protein [Firmicutes bacterium]|nr:SpoIID/LytB domain protein [Bacillota bacterium]